MIMSIRGHVDSGGLLDRRVGRGIGDLSATEGDGHGMEKGDTSASWRDGVINRAVGIGVSEGDKRVIPGLGRRVVYCSFISHFNPK